MGQMPLKGPCDVKPDQVEILSQADIVKFLGIWYSLVRIPNALESGECSTSLFNMLTPTLGFVTMWEVLDGVPRYWYASITRDSNAPEKFIFSYNGQSLDYYILGTNYNGYALLYSCQNTDDGNRNVWAWLMSRTRQFSPSLEELQGIQAAVERNPDVQNASWVAVDQNNC
ncbi:apolipoprotein D-like [Pectinophora gossypiella]|uniref:apolipoprotein D-like n=1 Tax=Pectinophora gossypiella TaxID=13191 RepID=UPI00214F4185|nr:apolipoprotein D-like [Pectinophora gossypiella]